MEVTRHGSVRRAKLYYLRGLQGRAARIKELNPAQRRRAMEAQAAAEARREEARLAAEAEALEQAAAEAEELAEDEEVDAETAAEVEEAPSRRSDGKRVLRRAGIQRDSRRGIPDYMVPSPSGRGLG